MTDYKAGDRVSLEHTDGSRLVNRVVFHPYGLEKAALAVNYAEGVTDSRADFVSVPPPTPWRVTDHKPKIELPTENGGYSAANGFIWVLVAGVWVLDGIEFTPTEAVVYAPFTRLVPEGSEREAAIREVIAHYEHMQYHDGYLAHHANARRKFGITE